MDIGYTEKYKGHTITLEHGKKWRIVNDETHVQRFIPTYMSPYRWVDEKLSFFEEDGEDEE